MNPSQHVQDDDVLDQAMAAFLADAINAKVKNKKIKTNMECRRKLEIKSEQRRLAQEISDFDFT